MMCRLFGIYTITDLFEYYLICIQSLACLNKVILFSRRAPIDVQSADRYTELSHIIAQGP